MVLGTRGSTLARTQTQSVSDRIRSRHPEIDIEIRPIRTSGDLQKDRPLSEIGGKGLFVKELESALQRGEIDMAVHSLKDVPAVLAPGLTLGAVLARADSRDVLITRDGTRLQDLRKGAVIATGSMRRAVQLKAMRPDVEVRPIRGNVDTRLRKLDEGQYDALVLAAAGLERLGRSARVTEFLEPEVMLPAVGQGVLALELRSDSPLLPIVAELDDETTRVAITAERAFLARLGAGCELPVAAYARLQKKKLVIEGLIARDEGTFVRSAVSGPARSAAELGDRLAGELLISRLRVLVTRPRHQAGTLTERLRQLGAEPVELSLIEIAPLRDYAELDAALARLDQYHRIIFTSANGVAAVFERLCHPERREGSVVSGRGEKRESLAPPDHHGSLADARDDKIIAIGPATAAALTERGIKAAWFPSEYVAEAIVREIGDVAGQRILLPRADIARPALAEGLRARGAIVDAIAAYRTVPAQGSREVLERILERGVDVVTFLSSSTVRQFAALADPDRLNGVAVACIGPITAATARELGFRVDIVAEEYTADGLVEAIRNHVGGKQ